MNGLLDSTGNDMEEDASNSVSDIQLDTPSCWIKYSEAELKQLLLYAAIELESVRASAQSQKQAHETLIEHLEVLVESARRERDETREQCVSLINQLAARYVNAGSVARTDDSHKFDITHHPSTLSYMNSLNTGDHINTLEILKPLPERGKLVEAVVKAGPLLQTLLVAGPLPQWRYPPPPSSAVLRSPPQLITPQTTNAPFHPPPGLRHNDFCCCCTYNNNAGGCVHNIAGGFAPQSFNNFQTHLSSLWEVDGSRRSSEECQDGQTMMSTETKPAMRSPGVMIQPTSNFRSERECFTPPTRSWNRTL